MKVRVMYLPIAVIISLCLLLANAIMPLPNTAAAQGQDLVAWGVTQVNVDKPDEYSQIFKLNLNTGYIQIIRDNPADPLYSGIGVAPTDKWLYAIGRDSSDKKATSPDGTSFPNYRDWYRLNPTTAAIENIVLNAIDPRANAMYGNEGGAFGFNFQVIMFIDGPGVSPEYGDSNPHLRSRGYVTGGNPDSPSALATRDEGAITVTDPPAGMTYKPTGGLLGGSPGLYADKTLHATFEVSGGKTALVEIPTTGTGVSQEKSRYISTIDFVADAIVYGGDWKQEAYAVSDYKVYKLNAQTGSTTFYLDLEPFLKGPIVSMTAAVEKSLSGVSISTSTLTGGQMGTSYQAALTASGGTSPYSWQIDSGALPGGLSLSPTGTISGTPSAAGEFKFMVAVTDATSHKAFKKLSITVTAAGTTTPTPAPTGTGSTPTPAPTGAGSTPTPAPTATAPAPSTGVAVTTTTLPIGEMGKYYAVALNVSGGTEPYTWKIASGVLPAGLKLSDSGVIWGRPTNAGKFDFTVKVTDNAGKSGSGALSIKITRLAIDTANLSEGQVGKAYEVTLAASGGTAPYTWVISRGSLPTGLTLSMSGVISGTPTIAQTFYFTVQVTDGASSSAIRELSIYIPFSWSDSFDDESRVLTKENMVISGGSAVIAPPKTYTYNFTDAINNKAYEGTSFNTSTEVPATAYQIMAYVDAVEYAYKGTTEYRYQVYHFKVNQQPSEIDKGTIKWTGSASHGYTLFLFNAQSGQWEQWADSGTTETGIRTNEHQVANFSRYIDGSGYVKIAARTSVVGRPGFFGIGLRNVTIRTDYVELLVQLFPPPSGSITSIPIERPGSYSWVKFTASQEVPAGTSIVYSILNAADNSVLGTITSTQAASGYDISTLAKGINSIKLHAVLGSGSSPVIMDWAVQAYDTLPVIATRTLPAGQTLQTYQATLVSAGGVQPYSWQITQGTLPPGLTLTATGVISGTPTTGGSFYFTARMTDAGGRQVASEFSITISDLQISTVELRGGQVGVPYRAILESSGGTPPYIWERPGGLLPDGLTFSSAGVLSGTPTVKGDFVVMVKLTDGNGFNTGKSFLIKITQLVFEPPAKLTNGQVELGYKTTLTAYAYGGTPPYTWEITKGTLPTGLELNPNTGKISGTLTAAGVFDFTIRVTDTAPMAVSRDLSITVTQLMITATTLPEGRGGLTYEATIEASGGTLPYTWEITEGTLPTGLKLNPNTGKISGKLLNTPAVFDFTVQVTDGANIKASTKMSITVNIPKIDGVLPNAVPKNEEYTSTLKASGGVEPYKWQIINGALPDGLMLDPDTGVISGNASRGGDFSFTVKVADATGREDVKDYSIEVMTKPSKIREIITTAWWIIPVIVFIILVIALVIYFIIRRRRKKRMSKNRAVEQST